MTRMMLVSATQAVPDLGFRTQLGMSCCGDFERNVSILYTVSASQTVEYLP